MLADAVFTRVGVFDYRDANGNIISEFRPPEEVGRKESLDSMQLVPFTNEHPSAMLTVDTAKQYQAGTVGELIKFDGTEVTGRVLINDRETINDTAKGKRQVSMGYEADVVDITDAMDIPSVASSPGVWNGKPYTKVQRNILYNHGSLVTMGRAGPSVQLRLDSALSTEINMTTEKKDAEMREVEIPGFGPLEMPIEAAVALSMLLADKGQAPAPAPAAEPQEIAPADEMGGEEMEEGEEEEEMDKKDKKKDALIASLKAKCDAYEEKLSAAAKKDSAEDFDKKVRARVQLERDACKLAKCDHSEFTKLSDMDVRKHALKTIGAKYDADDAYVVARFDAALDMLSDAGVKTLADKVATQKTDSEVKKDSRPRRDGMGPLTVSKQR